MGFLFSKPRYNPTRDIPDLHTKVAIVTGADVGIGFQTALQLATHGARVYLSCITMHTALDAVARMEDLLPSLRGQNRLVPLELDLSSIAGAKIAAEQVLRQEKRLDIIVNNAGRLASHYILNQDGVEQSVAVNHIGHFVLTTTLLPLLKATADLPDADVRIISLSSSAHELAPTCKFQSVEDFNNTRSSLGQENDWIAKFRRYGVTKLMVILTVAELQRRLDADSIPITVLAVHPGEVGTDGAKAHIPAWVLPYVWMRAITPYEGAFTTLFAATSPVVAAQRDKYKGRYIVPYGKIGKLTTKDSQDAALARTLWETTERIVERVLASSATV